MDVKLRVVWFSWMMMVPFLWFVMLARRTFRVPELGGPGMILGGIALMSGLALGAWAMAHGVYGQVPWAIGTVLMICSVFLYESARHVITGRGFCVALSGEVPPAVCAEGPYRYIRHPVYTSYLLAFLGFAVAIPALPSAAVFAGNLVFFVVVAVFEERTIAHSALAQAYATYR